MPVDNPPPSDPSRGGTRRGLKEGTLEGELPKREPSPRQEPIASTIGTNPGDMENFAHVRPGDTDGDLTEAGPAELAAVEGLEPGDFAPAGDQSSLTIANKPEDAPGSTVGTEADEGPRGEGDGEISLPETDPDDPERFGNADESAKNLDAEADLVDNQTDDDGVHVDSAEAVHDDKVDPEDEG